jgi:nicotinamidase/pyrazinamidase
MVSYDPRTALVVVDIQNDFADPAGSLSVRGGHTIIPEVNAQIERAKDGGALVVYTQDWHPEHTPHFAKDGGIWPDHCIQNTWGAAFHPELVVDGEIIRKGADGRDGYSAFSVRDPHTGETAATELGRLLEEHGVGRVVVCGLATDYCVVETVCDGRMLGFDAEVLRDAIAAVDLQPGDGDRAIVRMRDAGAEVA